MRECIFQAPRPMSNPRGELLNEKGQLQLTRTCNTPDADIRWDVNQKSVNKTTHNDQEHIT